MTRPFHYYVSPDVQRMVGLGKDGEIFGKHTVLAYLHVLHCAVHEADSSRQVIEGLILLYTAVKPPLPCICSTLLFFARTSTTVLREQQVYVINQVVCT